ncbi:MAG: hypothetical protein EPN26_04360 [Rhodospirillales bacterium]|nr:MAG: hypothetical protein EPN26_04360 [Rhodospirillales bacterium]
MNKTTISLGLLGAMFAALGAAWLFNGQGVIRNDPDRHIYIPDELTVPLQVRAAYNGERIFFQYRWPSQRPGIHMDAYKFEGGKWVKYGEDKPGPQDHVFLEDRVAMMVDDGGVPEFAHYGGYVTIGSGMDSFTKSASGKDVEAHPYLGNANKKQGAVTKHLPQTREVSGDWSSVVSEGQLTALRKAGYFLDLWHWRAHRSNVMGFADDQNISELRGGDPGKSGWSSNWDKEKKQPKYMFDPARTNRAANNWNDLTSGKVGQDDIYYLNDDTKVEFDPNYPWKEGDVLPARVLRTFEASMADIKTVGKGRWKDGFWEVTLSRLMDTGDTMNDKEFHDRGVFDLAFAVHRNSSGLRWHYVSLPVTVGLGRSADFTALRFEGEMPVWSQPWHTVKLFYPGQVNWPLLTSNRHPGKPMIERGIPVKHYHKEEQLSRYGIEIEFLDEIKAQWFMTLFAGLFMFACVGFGLVRLQTK